jgi:hypothetical protein
MIVGPAKFDEGSTTMAEVERMTAGEVVAKLMGDEHADFCASRCGGWWSS